MRITVGQRGAVGGGVPSRVALEDGAPQGRQGLEEIEERQALYGVRSEVSDSYGAFVDIGGS